MKKKTKVKGQPITRLEFDKIMADMRGQPWFKVIKYLEDPTQILDADTADEKFGIKNLARLMSDLMDDKNKHDDGCSFQWTIRKEIRNIKNSDGNTIKVTHYRRDIDHPEANWTQVHGDKAFYDMEFKDWNTDIMMGLRD